MKIRNDYVSNSSSSSFIVAYDKNFLGDLEDFISKISSGCETQVRDLDDFFDDDYMDKEDYHRYKNAVEKAKENKMEVIYFYLDYDFSFLIDLLKLIDKQNGGNKFNIIFDSEE